MLDLNIYTSSPFGSLVTLPQPEQGQLLEASFLVPPGVKQMLVSPKSGAFIRGLTRTYNLPANSAPKIAAIILRVGVGLAPITQLPQLLSNSATITTNLAPQIAQEIERDLFAPIMLEYNQYLSQLKKPTASSPAIPPSGTHPTGARNVLDLKNQRPVPPPPPIPPRQ